MRRSTTAILGLLLIGTVAAPASATPLGAAAGAMPLAAEAATPVAMCGRSCRGGGRYIPGPPSVCYEEGLRYCGSSRDVYGPPRRRYYEERDYYAPRPPGFGIYIR